MENRFKKYLIYNTDKKGKIIKVNKKAFELADEAFRLFKSTYNAEYGSIEEDDNLIAIHTGGWSDNEELIREFQETSFWFRFHEITARGGHYYFNTDSDSDKEWQIIINK